MPTISFSALTDMLYNTSFILFYEPDSPFYNNKLLLSSESNYDEMLEYLEYEIQYEDYDEAERQIYKDFRNRLVADSELGCGINHVTIDGIVIQIGRRKTVREALNIIANHEKQHLTTYGSRAFMGVKDGVAQFFM